MRIRIGEEEKVIVKGRGEGDSKGEEDRVNTSLIMKTKLNSSPFKCGWRMCNGSHESSARSSALA